MSTTSIANNVQGIVSQLTGATSTTAGTSGSTSTPDIGSNTLFQRGDAIFATPTLTGSGSPQSVVTASVGNSYWDTTNSILWIKATGAITTTGWIQASSFTGTAVLVAGTVVVPNTSIASGSIILLTCQVLGGAPGFLRVSSRTASTSFTIVSSSGVDTSTVGYSILF